MKRDLSEPSFAFLLRNVERRKRGRKEDTLYADAPVPLFCVFTRVLFPEGSKEKREEKLVDYDLCYN